MKEIPENCSFEFCRSLATAVTHLSVDGNLAMGFLDKIYLFFQHFSCVFVFCGECGCICMIGICVADNQLITLTEWQHQYECWSAIMDHMAHICMIIICVTLHISMWLLTIINNLCECLVISVCLAIRVCMWVLVLKGTVPDLQRSAVKK